MARKSIIKAAKAAACAFLSCAMVFALSSGASADSISELRDKKAGLGKQLSEIKKNRDSTVIDRNNTAYEAHLLDLDMEDAQNMYNYYVDLIAWADEQLELLEADLAKAQEDYDKQYEAFQEHARYMNENDRSGFWFLEILLNSQSFNDLLNNAELVKSLLDYDKEMTEKLLTQKENVEALQASREEFKLEIETLKADQEAYMAEIEQKQEEKRLKLEELYGQEDYFNQMIADIEGDDKALSQLIRAAEEEELARQRSASGNTEATQTVYVGGVLQWPVPSSTKITSPYGYRKHPITKKNDFHNGIDISAKSSNSITAAGNGKVIFVGTQGSYGKLVIVDHGGGISTAYAHCSAYAVSVGQTVSKGDTIAKIGSTGQSTGPHLHFEVRKDGSSTNPLDYLKGN